MKKTILFILLLSYNIFAQDTLNIATVPWKAKQDLQKFYQPLFDLIEEKTPYKVHFMITKNYAELALRVKEKAVDIALFGANSYIEAKYSNPYLVYLATIKLPEDHYNSLIITKKDSNIKTLEDLQGKNFAFTDIGSTSGYIYPNFMLYQAGIKDPGKFFNSVSMLKKHPKVYNAVASGAIDAGACSTTSLQKAIQKNGDIYRILQKSRPIPSDPIVAGGHIYPRTIEILLKLFKDPKTNQYIQKYESDFKGISVKDDAYYDIVREVSSFVKNRNNQ
jgi:phosphonate transport system substrate-binding protein